MADQTLNVRITADDKASGVLRGLQGTIGGLGNTLGSAAKGLATVGLGLGAGALGLGTVVAKTGIDFLAMKESAMVAFSTILGSGDKATQLMNELQVAAAKTPYEFEQLSSGAKMLAAVGTEAKDIVPTLTRIGDVASGVNIPLNELVDIYAKSRSQGRLYAADFNQFVGRGIPLAKELAKQFNVSEDEVRGLVEAGKVGFPQLEGAFKSLTSEGGMFFNMMDAQSKTLSGMTSTLLDNVKQMAGTAMEPLFELAKEAVGGLNDLLGSPEVQAGVTAFAAGLRQGIQDAKEVIGELKQDIGGLISDFQAGGIDGVLGGLSEKGVSPELINGLQFVVDRLGEIGGAITAIGLAAQTELPKMGQELIDRQPEFDKVGAGYVSMFTDIGKALGTVSGTKVDIQFPAPSQIFGMVVDQYIAEISKPLKYFETLKQIFEGLRTVGLGVGEAQHIMVSGLLEAGNTINTTVAGAFNGFYTNTLQPFLTGFQFLGGAIKGVIDWLNELARILGVDVGKGFMDILHVAGIPGFAGGTHFAPGGLALVGERGPELVNLPRGSQVIPNQLLSGGGASFQLVYAPTISTLDRYEVEDRLRPMVEELLRKRR